MADQDPNQPKQPFVPQADRPELRLKSETPLSELRVRDLATLVGIALGTRKDFWDGKDWQKDDFDGSVKWLEKQFKEGKEFDKPKPDKIEKPEKIEKRESKELKLEKLESDGVFDPGFTPQPDPRIDQVIGALTALTRQVGQLADQVAEIKKTGKG